MGTKLQNPPNIEQSKGKPKITSCRGFCLWLPLALPRIIHRTVLAFDRNQNECVHSYGCSTVHKSIPDVM